jgi:cleavage and polyadenylation specificity factor subunit 1
MFQAEGLLPGGGLCLEKIPLGVTVRRIQFIDDVSVSSRGRCLYAVLVSRELEVDMSSLNDDGMSEEERQRIEQEKEAAKIKRQVEADLGGFDVEQEWVEEIEREDCFQIDKELGGAPPIPQSAYALWVVDAANRWMVVDSHELGEYEHGMTMRVMSLTDVSTDLLDFLLAVEHRTLIKPSVAYSSQRNQAMPAQKAFQKRIWKASSS